MDLDNIFGLFGFNKDNDNSKEESYLKEIEEYKSTPKYKVGMFYKMISNGIQFRGQLIKFFEKSNWLKNLLISSCISKNSSFAEIFMFSYHISPS